MAETLLSCSSHCSGMMWTPGCDVTIFSVTVLVLLVWPTVSVWSAAALPSMLVMAGAEDSEMIEHFPILLFSLVAWLLKSRLQ